jgi:hypothetical protein
MAPYPLRGRDAELQGRRRECAALDRLIEAVRAGESRALVVRGEPGMGKTALLDYLAGHAEGCRVVRAAGVQSRWNSRSRPCTSCARRCWTAWIICRARSATRWGPRSASAPARSRTGS